MSTTYHLITGTSISVRDNRTDLGQAVNSICNYAFCRPLSRIPRISRRLRIPLPHHIRTLDCWRIEKATVWCRPTWRFSTPLSNRARKFDCCIREDRWVVPPSTVEPITGWFERSQFPAIRTRYCPRFFCVQSARELRRAGQSWEVPMRWRWPAGAAARRSSFIANESSSRMNN